MALTSFLIIVWPDLDQPWWGFRSPGDMLSSAYWWQLSHLPLPPEGRFACRGTETTTHCSDCKMFSYGKEESNLKIGLGPKWMHGCLHLQCRCIWTGRSFRQRLHSGSLSLAEVSARSSRNSYYFKTQIIQQTLRETCTLKCKWLSPVSTKASGSPIISSQGEQKPRGHTAPPPSSPLQAWGL